MIKFYLICILILLSGCSECNYLYLTADDVGLGKTISLEVQANDKNTFTDTQGNKIVKWKDTGLTVSNNENGTIILSVDGKWKPFGEASKTAEWRNSLCHITSCSVSYDIRCRILNDLTTEIVSDISDNEGCALANGQGIYILFAKRNPDGTYNNPNLNIGTAISPTSRDGFYTSHIGAFPTHENGSIYIENAWSYVVKNKKISFEKYSLKDLIGSRIYLKVMDGDYNDNTSNKVGYYNDNTSGMYINVKMTQGIFYPHFISTAITILKDTLNIASESLNKALLDSFKSLIRILILLYFAITAFGFMSGLVQLTQTEAVVRLLKIGIVLILTTKNEALASDFFHFFEHLASFVANIIVTQLPNMVHSINNDVGDALVDRMAYLNIYDMQLNQLSSAVFHQKIWSLLFTLSFFWIPFLYVLVVMIVMVLIRALLLYITAYMQLSILFLITPLLAVMLLFNVTADLFKEWLKAIINSALIIVVATLGMGLVLGLMNAQMFELLRFSVSNKRIWLSPFITFCSIQPDKMSEVNSVLNCTTYLIALISILICKMFVDNVPKFADALSDSQLSPTTNAFNALLGGMREFGKGILSFLDKLRAGNAKYFIGRALNQRYLGKDGELKEGKGNLDKFKIFRDQINYYGKYAIAPINMIQKGSISDVQKDLQRQKLNILKAQNAPVIAQMRYDLKHKAADLVNEFHYKDLKGAYISQKITQPNDNIKINDQSFTGNQIRESLRSGSKLENSNISISGAHSYNDPENLQNAKKAIANTYNVIEYQDSLGNVQKMVIDPLQNDYQIDGKPYDLKTIRQALTDDKPSLKNDIKITDLLKNDIKITDWLKSDIKITGSNNYAEQWQDKVEQIQQGNIAPGLQEEIQELQHLKQEAENLKKLMDDFKQLKENEKLRDEIYNKYTRGIR